MTNKKTCTCTPGAPAHTCGEGGYAIETANEPVDVVDEGIVDTGVLHDDEREGRR